MTKELATSIGIDIGGTKILAIAEDANGTLLAQTRTETPHSPHAEAELVERLKGVINELSTIVLEKGFNKPSSAGIGIAGMVTHDGIFVEGPHLAGVHNLDLAKHLKEEFGNDFVVFIDNDANVAAWAEFRRGAGQGHEHMVLITFGTGIGGGIVINGELFRGKRGYAGELGHHVVQHNGVACECGRKGCWEQYASGNALGRFGRESMQLGSSSLMLRLAGGEISAIRGQHVVEAARAGDGAARTVVLQFASWIAEGLANVSNMLDVDAFVLGGGVAEAQDVVLEPIRIAYNNIAYRRDAEVVIAQLGETANAIGAADLARIASEYK